MSETMMQEILSRLDAIGAKLGEGAVFAWQTYLRQAVLVGGWLGVLEAAGYSLIAFILYRAIRYLWSKDDDDDFVIEEEVGCVVGSTFVGMAFLGFSALSVYTLIGAASHILNPSYYALMEIAKLVGN